jgi:hypothetical protein
VDRKLPELMGVSISRQRSTKLLLLASSPSSTLVTVMVMSYFP